MSQDDDDDRENGHLSQPPKPRRRRGPFAHQDAEFFESGGWIEYRRLILSELEHINQALVSINEKIDDKIIADVAKLQAELAMLKVRSGLWGAAAAVLTTVGIILIYLITGSLKIVGR